MKRKALTMNVISCILYKHADISEVSLLAYQIGWFSTGRDEAARELLQTVYDAINDGTIRDTEIAFVFSNRERGEAEESDNFFDLVDEYKIDLVCFSSAKYMPELRNYTFKDSTSLKEWRQKYHAEVMVGLDKYSVDLNVLAGYMLIVSPEMCEKYDMINLHPAKPGGPAGTWQEVIWELLRTKADETGVMMHLVTRDLDEGPAITYCSFPIKGGGFDKLWTDFDKKLESKTLKQIIKEEGEGEPLFAEIRRQGVMREMPLIVYTIKEFAEGKISIRDNQVIDAEGKVYNEGYCLNDIMNDYRGV